MNAIKAEAEAEAKAEAASVDEDEDAVESTAIDIEPESELEAADDEPDDENIEVDEHPIDVDTADGDVAVEEVVVDTADDEESAAIEEAPAASVEGELDMPLQSPSRKKIESVPVASTIVSVPTVVSVEEELEFLLQNDEAKNRFWCDIVKTVQHLVSEKEEEIAKHKSRIADLEAELEKERNQSSKEISILKGKNQKMKELVAVKGFGKCVLLKMRNLKLFILQIVKESQKVYEKYAMAVDTFMFILLIPNIVSWWFTKKN